jgi:hypothetical protein
MKNLFLSIVIFILLLLNFGCTKDSNEVILPESVEIGKSKVYLNGEEVDYLPFIGNDTINKVIHYLFSQSKDNGSIINGCGFGSLALKIGDYQLTDQNSPFTKAFTTFHQTIDGDVTGYEYKLSDQEDGFLKIESLDSIKLEVKGSFRAKFCRTSKNGNKNLGLPKTLLFQGIFFETYLRR